MKKIVLLVAVALGMASCKKEGVAPDHQVPKKTATLTVAADPATVVADTVQVSSEFGAKGAVTFGFTLTAGESDIKTKDLYLTLAGSVDPSNIAQALLLYDNASTLQIESENITQGSPIVRLTNFSDNNVILVPAKTTKSFTVKVNVNPIGTSFHDGDWINFSITSSNVAAIVATDATGKPLSAENLKGSAIGKKVYFKE